MLPSPGTGAKQRWEGKGARLRDSEGLCQSLQLCECPNVGLIPAPWAKCPARCAPSPRGPHGLGHRPCVTSAWGSKLAKQNSEPFSPVSGVSFTSHNDFQKTRADRPRFIAFRRCWGERASASRRSPLALLQRWGPEPAVSPRSACSAPNSTGDPPDGPASGTHTPVAKVRVLQWGVPCGNTSLKGKSCE